MKRKIMAIIFALFLGISLGTGAIGCGDTSSGSGSSSGTGASGKREIN